MQFNIKFIAAAALVAASPGMAATLSFDAGGNCSGLILGSFDDVQPFQCTSLAADGTAASISYSNITNQLYVFPSSGSHTFCGNGIILDLYGGSGCGTAPAGTSIEAAFYF
ncbi:hypothetical protein B0H16DRAFT_586887 [Mycena metata]|uniref:Uncharacterized protein n=1 Tax=Mycena metata TaxID=1033252 RepID=A0AAD7J9K6_9AGAR|nr:hypothetical protein B0H16DRAFT_586887 [Mycena metata]